MTPSALMVPKGGRLFWLGAMALLVIATFVVYLPAAGGGFIWDDDGHVTKPELRSLHGLWRIWFELGATQQYYPLVHSVFWIEHRLWGDRPLGYHVVNILLHALCACLVFGLLRRLKIPGAYLAAAIFALHPIEVETVAWVTELKNTLSGLFYLSSAWAYLEFDEKRERKWYAAALVLFVLGLLGKTVIATLPAALLVLFWWKKGTLSWKRDAAPLVPWLGLGAASGLFTAWVEHTLIGAQGEAFALGAIERGLLAGRVVWFYLGKLFWPSPLIFIYPRWDVSRGVWWQYLPPLGAAGLAAMLWLLRGRWRGPLAAMLFFVGTLFPVLGFFNVYPFLFSYVADHFQYLPGLGAITLASAGIALGIARLPMPVRPAGWGAAVALVGLLAVLTWRQSAIYSDVETLYRTTVKRNPTCWMAYNNLGNLLTGSGRAQEAVGLLREAVRIKPDYAGSRNNLGVALDRTGDEAGALEQFEATLKFRPDFASAHVNLGTLLSKSGRIDEAIGHFQQALKINAMNVEARCNLGNALSIAGRFDESIAQYRQALTLKPDDSEAHASLGNVLAKAGRAPEAIEPYNEALRLNPSNAELQNALASILLGLDRLPEAIEHCNAALRLKPDDADALNNLGLSLARMNRLPDAVDRYRQALRIRPDSAETHNNLGVALARMNRMPEAIEHFQEALRIKPDYEGARANLRRAQEAR
jgi:tetratricopeptide (TPR) repeat protein